MKAVIFQTQGEDFGISIEHVVSIEKVLDLKPIPNLPDYVKGVMPIRGELVPVIDVSCLFKKIENNELEKAKIITVQTDELTAGLLVSEAKEILELEQEQLKLLPIGAGASSKWFSSIAMKDSRLITLVNPASFIGTLEALDDIKSELLTLNIEENEKASI
ncbi:chemotaxis protein CheW [Metabacillus sp. FJAT-52054]|uniref:Chemotaxis protein CheW n=1 Tax=Metabacillus sediminis TaxID=3117746 RepID=A0ABZ2NE01_9BACI